ncbi:peroxiredoxin family protein [Dokdonia sp.]|uniref:peroxiredoxin family protein n=1 Tax=Dokdonia sp. TaxID=2024995 RepID=UPI0032658756
MQNLLKSIFISIFPVFALYVVIQYIWVLLQTGFSTQSLGMIIAALPVVIFFAGLFLKPVARTKRYLNIYTNLIGIGFVISMIGYAFDSIDQAHLLGVVLIIGWVLYLKWYSVFNKRNTTVLKVGEKLPNVTLENAQKETIPVADFLGNPTIYLFYRGNWCPLCMAQIKEIVDQYKILEERGVNTVFISPQPHKYSENLSKKHGLQFHFLTDANNTTAKQLGILSKNGIPFGFQTLGYDSDTVLPTVVITDKEGIIQFVDLTDNYRVRPEPDFFMKYV